MQKRILIYICLFFGLIGLLVAGPADSVNPLNNVKPKIEWWLSQYWPHSQQPNLWQALKNHFKLNHDLNQPAVKREIRFLLHRQDYINELTENAEPYLFYVYSQTQKDRMPAEIALVPMIESDYDPFGVSRTGATGLWQMMPGTASALGVKMNWWYDGRRNVIISTKAALRHLYYLHSYFGTWPLALAAYDCGDGTVRAAIRYNKRHHKPTDFWHLHLPKETKLYVPKLLALAAIIEQRHHYGLRFHKIPNQPYFTGIRMHGQIELSRIAKLSNTDIKTLRELNPAFRRWATTPSGSYWLLLPSDKAAIFEKNLNQSKQTPINWIHYHVKQGDTLGALALKNHTTVTIVKRVNHLNNSIIHIGQTLLIPRSHHANTIDIKKQNARIAEDKIPGPKHIVHTIKSNENLWTIAARYHVTPSQIRSWNRLPYHSKLQANQQLIIWKKQKTSHTNNHTYTVKKGDSLSRIADHYHTTAKQIMQSNHLKTTVLQIGQKLKITILPIPNIDVKKK